MNEGGAAKLAEVLAVTALVLVAIRGVVALADGVGSELPLALVPVLFMWGPVWWLRWRGEDPDQYPIFVPWPGEGYPWGRDLKVAGVAIAIVGPLFLVGYHLWHTAGLPWITAVLCDQGLPTCALAKATADTEPAWRWPSNPALLVAYHLFYVGIPEEMFYRGYVQSRLDEVWSPRWRVLGATVGPGLLVTSLVFALGHSVVAVQWWHLFIVFPSLVFGWMRARTGGILAGALFHAWSNVTVGVLDVVYGLQPP